KGIAPESTTGRKPIILAVDDKPNNLASLKAIIGDKYRFVGVTSGEDALQYLETNIPDVYILDLVMPGMDGFQLTEQIQKRRKVAPIIFLTASATADSVTRAFKLGVTDFLVKPCNNEAVHSKLERIIGNR
ncbi:MAG: response regulator, partial [Thermoguttaceae bacterium]